LFWLQGFVLLQFACQLALLVPGIGAVRMVVRCAAFGASLALLVLLPGRGPGHPARRWAPLILGLVALGLFHPTSNTFAAGAAQLALYGAILAPLFWVSRLPITPAVLRRLVLLLWAFQSLSAFFGVLQSLYPGRFQPNVSSVIASQSADRVESLKVTLANGERIFRPMGLTDIPGGAAGAGMYTVLFGMSLLLKENGWFRLAGVGGMVIGLFCIYLSQTRSILIMTGVCALSMAALLAVRCDWNRLITLGAVLAVVVVGAFLWAVAVGGRSVTARLATLTEDRADSVYYKNRGVFLEQTLTDLLPLYPFGAGLGRWGMTRQYLGDESDPFSYPIWVEIQWTGWLLDGGVPLMLVYSTALILTCAAAWRIARSRLPGDLPLEATVILAYDIGAVALTFNYPLFIGQGGLEFWLLNAVLFAAACTAARRERRLGRPTQP
jgi:hypothetical protein